MEEEKSGKAGRREFGIFGMLEEWNAWFDFSQSTQSAQRRKMRL